jgi:DNA-binding winged helix-turn-helix (wHTH) protein
MSKAAELGHRSVLRVGMLNVCPANGEVEGPKGSEHVEPRVMQVFLALSDAGGMTVTRQDLMANCWDGSVVGDDALNRVIGKIRKMAQGIAAGSFSVTTVPKIGYRLCADDRLEAGSLPL